MGSHTRKWVFLNGYTPKMKKRYKQMHARYFIDVNLIENHIKYDYITVNKYKIYYNRSEK